MGHILYFFVVVAATAAGALTGLGGGVIIKPVLDVFGDYDVATIGILSSATVFVMALVSIVKQSRQKIIPDLKMISALASGSLIGGSMGQKILTFIIASFPNGHMVITVQNLCLAVIILMVYMYMRIGEHRPTLSRHGIIPALLTGIILGTVSSFLGIGGGPVNVALIIFVFDWNIKAATYCSIITILFAQSSKLSSVLLSGVFLSHDLAMLPVMITGAVIGGWIGSDLNKRLSKKSVEKTFNGVQILVLFICLLNIFRNIAL